MAPARFIPIPEIYVSADAAEKLTDEAQKLQRWTLTATQLCDLEMLMNGGFFPLRGFMTEADCTCVKQDGRLSSGAIWPVPVTLKVSDEFATKIEPGDDIALTDAQGHYLAIMSVTDHWQDKDTTHLGGRVKGLRQPSDKGMSPNELRQKIAQHDWEAMTLVQAPGETDGPALVMTFTGLLNDIESKAAINLAERTDGTEILRALVARNYGATHVPDAGKPEFNQIFKAAGLQILRAE